MKKQYVPTSLGEFINESKTITLKRGYGERQPVVVGSAAPLRNQVLAFVSESVKVSRNELRQFIAGLNENNSPAATSMWIKRNAQYFITESKNGVTYYKLSTVGQRLANRFERVEDTTVSEGLISEVLTEKMKAKKTEDCEECEGDDKADFYDKKKGYPRPGLNDMTESTDESVEEDRVERVLESLRKKRALLEAEETEEEKPEEEEEAPAEEEPKEEKSDDDEFNLDDLDMETGDGGDETEAEPEGEDKVEITEFILTVDNPAEAIKELKELGISAEKVSPEAEDGEAAAEEKEGEGNDLDLDLGDETEAPAEGEGEEAPAEGGDEDLNIDLEEAAEGEGEDLDINIEDTPEAEPDAEPEPEADDTVVDMDADKEVGDEAEGQIKVSAEDWETLKGWLEGKGVDVAEMFGGEIEVEDGEEAAEEGEEEEVEGEEEKEEGEEEEAEGEEGGEPLDLGVETEKEE